MIHCLLRDHGYVLEQHPMAGFNRDIYSLEGSQPMSCVTRKAAFYPRELYVFPDSQALH